MTKKEMEILKELRVKMIKSFMEIFILAQLRMKAMSGYDIIASIHKVFGIMVSPGTVYTRIYRMERDGLIEGNTDEKKRIYMLTEKGEKIIEDVLNAKKPILEFIDEFLGNLREKHSK